jgi:hypothetical protein
MAFPAKLGLVLVSALCVRAQLVTSAKAGLIDYAQGTVYLDTERLRAGGALRQMRQGQTLSTTQGRVEVLLAPGIVMRLGDNASVRIDDTSLEDIQVAISKGPAFIEVVERDKYARLRVFVGGSETEFKHNGLYRFESAPARLQVYGGETGVMRGDAQVIAKRGQAVDLSVLSLLPFDPRAADSLHTWAAQRSFTLYNASVENRQRQKHWKYIGDGWLWNRNYGAKYRSAQARHDNAWAEEQLRLPGFPRADSKKVCSGSAGSCSDR